MENSAGNPFYIEEFIKTLQELDVSNKNDFLSIYQNIQKSGKKKFIFKYINNCTTIQVLEYQTS